MVEEVETHVDGDQRGQEKTVSCQAEHPPEQQHQSLNKPRKLKSLRFWNKASPKAQRRRTTQRQQGQQGEVPKRKETFHKSCSQRRRLPNPLIIDTPQLR